MPKLADQPEILDMVLERMANGEILTAIAREIGYTAGAFSMLADRDPAFRERYARARILQAAAVAEDVVRIVDDEDDPERAQLARNRADARKWLASKLDPAKFSDKQRHEVMGEGGGPVELAVLSPAEKAARASKLIDDAFTALPKPDEK